MKLAYLPIGAPVVYVKRGHAGRLYAQPTTIVSRDKRGRIRVDCCRDPVNADGFVEGRNGYGVRVFTPEDWELESAEQAKKQRASDLRFRLESVIRAEADARLKRVTEGSLEELEAMASALLKKEPA